MTQNIRNIAVIAHVDHGKTTLVDAILKQTHVFRENEEEMAQTLILDSNELEKERGITILAKNCSVRYQDTKINIIDTPGHADFSGEVERTLGMADGALLIVDAAEGPMPQTRFVLKKALELKLAIIVVINKIDKKYAKPAETLAKIESLFLELADDPTHLEFSVLYAVGRDGVVWDRIPEDFNKKGDVTPLLAAIIQHVPAPVKKTGPFKMVISSLDYSPHLGQMAVGKIFQGRAEKGMPVVISDHPDQTGRIEKLMVFEGLKKKEAEAADTGEIVCIGGLTGVKIGQTMCHPEDTVALPGVIVGEPTLHVLLGPNTSPFSGREGQFTTGRQIEERLNKELQSNLSLRVEKTGGKFTVSGRGELHLAILLETMRREGYEMEVGKPEVIIKKTDAGTVEPVEEVSIVVPNEYIGIITEEFGKRWARLVKMNPVTETETEFVYVMATRAALGLRSLLMTATRGTLVYSSVILGYEPVGKPLAQNRRGVLIASEGGTSLAYGLENAQGRGVTFIEPATAVYEGMIVGVNSKENDITVNVCKGKKLTNMRSKSHDGVIQLTPPVILTLEQALDFVGDDELLEITPQSLRLRKKYLTELDRKRAGRAGTSIQVA